MLVDESQDTNAPQFQLLRLLVGPDTSLFAVGDPNQARGARRARQCGGGGVVKARGPLATQKHTRKQCAPHEALLRRCRRAPPPSSLPFPPPQGIYYFRGSNPAHLTAAEGEFQGIVTKHLIDNYR